MRNGEIGHLSLKEQSFVVQLILRPKTSSFKSLQIFIYSPELIKKGKIPADTCRLQSQLPPKKMSCGTDRISVASGKRYSTLQTEVSEMKFPWGGKNKQTSK